MGDIQASTQEIDHALALAQAKEFTDRLGLEAEIKEGGIVEGTITALHDYGAFVSLGAFTALLPVSEIARERIADISTQLSVGQTIKAQVLKTDWKNERVTLSIKALTADPWDAVAQKYCEGDKIEIKMSRHRLKLIGCSPEAFYTALRSKLAWSGSPLQE